MVRHVTGVHYDDILLGKINASGIYGLHWMNLAPKYIYQIIYYFELTQKTGLVKSYSQKEKLLSVKL